MKSRVTKLHKTEGIYALTIYEDGLMFEGLLLEKARRDSIASMDGAGIDMVYRDGKFTVHVLGMSLELLFWA